MNQSWCILVVVATKRLGSVNMQFAFWSLWQPRDLPAETPSNPSNDCAWLSLNLCQVMSGSCQKSSNENVSGLVSRMQYRRTL